MEEPRWSREYCGISYIVNIPKRYHIGVSMYSHKFSRAYMIDKESDQPFTAIKEFKSDSMKKCIEQATEWFHEVCDKIT
ncbi:MAG: hypothetical protein SVK08_01530 [Halobacteriota archaeon]|nr:hypothetical protein [Halobacteriota archaeon]